CGLFAVCRTRPFALRERPYRSVPLGWSTGPVNILVLGGTVFLGRAVVAEAVADGAAVTVFNRGRSGPTPPGAKHIAGDRTDPVALAQLGEERYDLVIDTSGYVPADVRRSADLLADSCGHYVFISSINAYPAWPREPDYQASGVHDGDPDAGREDVPDGFSPAQSYGWLKVGCERAVVRAFGEGRSSILRAGSIVGPEDREVRRLPWWLERVARGGEVLVPGPPSATVSLIDVRDLARFALLGVAGEFDTSGPHERDTRADLMAACAAATGSEATFTYVEDEDWLIEQGVEYWTELPLWIPTSIGPSVFSHNSEPAQAAGLRWRPLAETVRDTWTWLSRSPQPAREGEDDVGLAPAREAELLAAWRRRSS
ncbi:MAG TPA: NAD-dependent epimerase/dehydratase family protein, partial [Jatrophihabitans sp.]|nr:NAD-dependent epimerase/dehydratase family protein [Jatrophihabitans sp.]